MQKRPMRATHKRRRAPMINARYQDKLRVLYTEQEIRKRVRELAAEINRDYHGKTLHVVGILENCFVFMADLVRALKIPVVSHFVRGDIHDRLEGEIPVREITYSPKVQAAGKDVLLVHGVMYSGVILDFLYRYLLAQGPNSVRTATLLEKAAEKKVDMSPDYLAFKARGKFLVGYGLGYEGRYHNLPCIAALGQRDTRRPSAGDHPRI